MKKKILGVILAGSMILSSGSSVFAADTEYGGATVTFSSGSAVYTAKSAESGQTATTPHNNGESAENNTFFVKASKGTDATSSTYGDTVYSVNIEWSATSATYNLLATTPHTWDPSSNQYTEGTTTFSQNSKSDGLATINVTNKSNAAVNYDISYTSCKYNNNTITASTETKSDTSADASGSLASCVDNNHAVLETAPSITYNGKIKISDDYIAGVASNIIDLSQSDNNLLGYYTVAISHS